MLIMQNNINAKSNIKYRIHEILGLES